MANVRNDTYYIHVLFDENSEREDFIVKLVSTTSEFSAELRTLLEKQDFQGFSLKLLRILGFGNIYERSFRVSEVNPRVIYPPTGEVDCYMVVLTQEGPRGVQSPEDSWLRDFVKLLGLSS